jgi:hypothetical protein
MRNEGIEIEEGKPLWVCISAVMSSGRGRHISVWTLRCDRSSSNLVGRFEFELGNKPISPTESSWWNTVASAEHDLFSDTDCTMCLISVSSY